VTEGAVRTLSTFALLPELTWLGIALVIARVVAAKAFFGTIAAVSITALVVLTSCGLVSRARILSVASPCGLHRVGISRSSIPAGMLVLSGISLPAIVTSISTRPPAKPVLLWLRLS
jgi:hypothetical protein